MRFLGLSSLVLSRGFWSFSLLVLSLSFFLGFSHNSTASAATPYDNLLHVTDKILIRDSNGNENDITTTYMGAVLSYLNDNPTDTHAQNLYSKLQSNTASGVGWSMIGYRDGVAGHGNAKTRWFLDIYDTNASGAFFNGPNGYTFGMSHYVGRFMFTWASGGLVATPNPSYDTQPWWGANTNCGSGSPEYMCFSPSSLTQTDIFYINTPIVYPPDYQGSQPPRGSESEPERQMIQPQFTFQLANKRITSRDYQQDLPSFTPDEGYTFVEYSVEWSLFKCASFDDVGNSCTWPDLKDHKINLQSQDYTFDVSEYGDYTLQAQYLVQQCFRYPSYPATPDYCFYVDLETEMPQYDFVPTRIHLKIDGQSLTGDTSKMTCDISGFCVKDEESCKLKPDFFSRINCDIDKATNVGILNPSITAFKKLLSSFMVPENPTCNIPLSNVTISPGKTFPLSTYSQKACTSAAQFRNAFPIVPILINFLLTLTILFLIVRILNQLTNHNDTELISGVK